MADPRISIHALRTLCAIAREPTQSMEGADVRLRLRAVLRSMGVEVDAMPPPSTDSRLCRWCGEEAGEPLCGVCADKARRWRVT